MVKAGGLSVSTRTLTFSTCQASPPDAYLRKGKRDIFVKGKRKQWVLQSGLIQQLFSLSDPGL